MCVEGRTLLLFSWHLGFALAGVWDAAVEHLRVCEVLS